MTQVYRVLGKLANGTSANFPFEGNTVFAEAGVDFTSAVIYSKKSSKYRVLFYLRNGSNLIVKVTSTFENDFELKIEQDEEAPFFFTVLMGKLMFLREMRKILLREIEQVTESE